jgi:hypothetical protein
MPGDRRIVDNLGSCEGQGVRKAIDAASVWLVFMPAYNPGLNSIDQVGAKLKHMLHVTEEQTVEATWRRTQAIKLRFLEQKVRYTTATIENNLWLHKALVGDLRKHAAEGGMPLLTAYPRITMSFVFECGGR